MAPLTRRQSRRLSGKATADERPAVRDSLSSVAGTTAGGGSGRVAKPERKSRVIASRYMSAAVKTNRAVAPVRAPSTAQPSTARTTATQPSATRTTAAVVQRPASRQTSISVRTRTTATNSTVDRQRPVSRAAPKPNPVVQKPVPKTHDTPAKIIDSDSTVATRAARRESRRATGAPKRDDKAKSLPSEYPAYVQWLLTEARSQMAYDDAKSDALDKLTRLTTDAEHARRLWVEEERKLQLMREFAALSKWMADNRSHLEAMKTQVEGVREPYARFGQSLAHTTRAMPISDVHFDNAHELVRDMQGFVDTVATCFPSESMAVQGMYDGASKLSRFYRAQRQEQELLAECQRLKESLEHSTALAISQGASDPIIDFSVLDISQ
ncbi:hypothetical protein GGH96_000017 [Coemansia sp. RSA 1972]|nr:hypothetical protein GGH96_000017 [Coemansia sp. RSA 1972]